MAGPIKEILFSLIGPPSNLPLVAPVSPRTKKIPQAVTCEIFDVDKEIVAHVCFPSRWFRAIDSELRLSCLDNPIAGPRSRLGRTSRPFRAACFRPLLKPANVSPPGIDALPSAHEPASWPFNTAPHAAKTGRDHTRRAHRPARHASCGWALCIRSGRARPQRLVLDMGDRRPQGGRHGSNEAARVEPSRSRFPTARNPCGLSISTLTPNAQKQTAARSRAHRGWSDLPARPPGGAQTRRARLGAIPMEHRMPRRCIGPGDSISNPA